ncbi:major tail protein [Bacillus phage Mgbh1]|uniref:Tail protein-like protein n=1 Tax=Bacillus phage Mgbh1 TaxID=1796993 RepID=A0A142F1M7_9CAUD|nr:major tail protein [Bacillus phage Mgbh1]AMQ66684.1 tail protein-like protein [Bacillus phage Mgbh1]
MSQAPKPIKGQKKVLFFQSMDGTETDGNKLRLAFQTEHTLSRERELIEEMTKDGMIKDTGDMNTSLDITSFVAHGDATFELLRDSFEENKPLQCWEVDVTEESAEGKYDAVYMQGILESFEESNGAEDFVELSTTFQVNLTPQRGQVTLTPDQFSAVQYAFQDFGELAGGGEG